MTDAQISQAVNVLKSGGRVAVVNPDSGFKFSIARQERYGVAGYGTVRQGRKRPVNYRIMAEWELENWLSGLEIQPVMSTPKRDRTNAPLPLK